MVEARKEVVGEVAQQDSLNSWKCRYKWWWSWYRQSYRCWFVVLLALQDRQYP